jgi:ElaB/YqjD/DUF883 family membrane-anchored ribosome-binding protein
MNENSIEGAAQDGIGKVESVAGDVLDNPGLKARGEARRLGGKAQSAVGSAEDGFSDVLDHLSDAVTRVIDQVGDVYDQLTDKAQTVVTDQVDPFVKEKPFVALGLAATVGLLAGLLIAGGRPKVIYVKPRA